MLSIIFEEKARYEYKENKRLNSQASSNGNDFVEEVSLEIDSTQDVEE